MVLALYVQLPFYSLSHSNRNRFLSQPVPNNPIIAAFSPFFTTTIIHSSMLPLSLSLSLSSSMAASLCLLCFLSLLTFISSYSKPTTISIPLNIFTPSSSSSSSSSSSQSQTFTHLAYSSLTRAKHIKNPHKTHLSSTPLSPQTYGGYSISLGFGTPSQTLPFVMDTGSEIPWFPCTNHYLCNNCSYPNSKISYYNPRSSSSVKLIGCQNPKCSWIHSSDVQSRCQDCSPNSKNCTQICPPYLIIYGSGSTGGLLLSETLNLDQTRVPNFVIGCSRFSIRIPTGIAGFGRGYASLPSQLGLSKFSYCLLSHRFEDTKKTTPLVLYSGSDSGDKKTTGVSYTPFVKNPVGGKSAFSVYYYVGLRKISVGGKNVKIPYDYLTLGSDGNGGTIVDSGSTFTFMEGRVFEPVVREIVNQVVHYSRDIDVEKSTGLRPCFKVITTDDISLPKLVLHFKGGADMELPLANYFSFIESTGVVCMTVVTNSVGGEVGGDGLTPDGPSVIFGNYQQQNFYVEYDLKNERFGFKQQTCE